ncbi:GAF domain-containing protein [Mangrovivirga sp. M17]|uniref:GAF domain-containing protein n=1 Tax=Mangrovivirga halotolerans TaxID=2993936 RepID=A0ABT3RU00_9BACT|nr:GAF domain-containing protein [Mangrovivirga halotolerans]MCX2744819.1 GAF domain-containing protein [Mangrovivirga halotolerans]
MKNKRIGLRLKVLGGFLILILLFTINAVFTVLTVNENDNTLDRLANIVRPSSEALAEFDDLALRTKMYTTNWVYLQTNTADKKKLELIHDYEYREIKEKLEDLDDNWAPQDTAKLDTVFQTFEQVLQISKQDIMSQLQKFTDYDDAALKFTAETALESLIPLTDSLQNQITELRKRKEAETQAADAELSSSLEQLKSSSIIVAIVLIIIGIASSLIVANSITKPVNHLKTVISKLGKGEIPETNTMNLSNDEIGDMALAVEKLAEGLKETSYFAEKIGDGNYDAKFKPLSDNDTLGNALIEMRDNLNRVAQEDKKRSWATEGQAMFGEILRTNNDNLKNLSEEIITNLVKYLKANQGGLFIINDTEEEPYLELMACYAWDKKKYLEQKVYKGDGLTGQAWLEKDKVFITDVPDEYISITSGLGDANPNSILIVPLKINEEVYGVVEIASFNVFDEYEIEFVEKIAESIASSISSVKVNERTQILLEESQELTEQMRSQEEEMRQNMEELQATQEEMERSQRERETKENIINNSLVTIELDSSFKFSTVNRLFTETLGYSDTELRNKAFLSLVENTAVYEQMVSDVKQGITWRGNIQLSNKNGKALSFMVIAGQVKDPISGEQKYTIYSVEIK